MTDQLPELIKPREACKVLSISDETLRRLIRTNQLRATKLGARTLRVYRDSVLALIERGSVDGASQ